MIKIILLRDTVLFIEIFINFYKVMWYEFSSTMLPSYYFFLCLIKINKNSKFKKIYIFIYEFRLDIIKVNQISI